MCGNDFAFLQRIIRGLSFGEVNRRFYGRKNRFPILMHFPYCHLSKCTSFTYRKFLQQHETRREPVISDVYTDIRITYYMLSFIREGWCDGAGKLPVPRRPTNRDLSRARA